MEKMDSFSILAQGVGLAFVTFLIPIAVMIFKETEFQDLDRNVILDHVLDVRFLVTSLALLILSPFLWKMHLSALVWIGFFVWILSIAFLLETLQTCYQWNKGGKFQLRFSYLKRLGDLKDMEESWRSVWNAEKTNSQNERKFFEIFTSKIDSFLNNKEEHLNAAFRLLDDFELFIKNRPINFLIFLEKFFPKILEWHFKTWSKQEEHLRQDGNQDIWINYNGILRVLGDIIKKIEERILKEGSAHSFFKYLEAHTQSIEICKNKQYLKDLFDIICPTFFDNIADSPERYDIWHHYLPEDWKVTKEDFQKKSTIVTSFLDNFIRWAEGRIIRPESDFDRKLENVASELFPEVDPDAWSLILIFVLPFHDIQNESKSIIEHKKTFGHIGRIRTGWGEYSVERHIADEKQEINNTIELSMLIFEPVFTEKNLEKYITELKALESEYGKKTNEERKRLKLLNLFEAMKDNVVPKVSK